MIEVVNRAHPDCKLVADDPGSWGCRAAIRGQELSRMGSIGWDP